MTVAPLTLDALRTAVAGTAAALRRKVTLQPAGGEGDKVFPPTYAGAVYHTERRRIDGQPVDCVVLDSVQSQANRMEEALQVAADEGDLELPLVVVDFSEVDLLDEIGRVTSLQAPHRIADAIFRDSLYDGVPFRESELGCRLDSVDIRNSTPVFDLCPTALVFGMWDSHGPKGGLGAKFERAVVSEIVAVDVQYGVRSSSRIDPLGIRKDAGPIYQVEEGGWTLDPDQAIEGSRGKPSPYGGGDRSKRGKPSAAGHGNITPGFAEYVDGASGTDPLTGEGARQGGIAVGGVTMSHAIQTTVLSLPVLRRLRFPLEDGASEADVAARTALAALALCGATLAGARGYDLRSRCALWPTEPASWSLLDRPGEEPVEFELDREQALALLRDAVDAAREASLPWRTDPVELRPSEELAGLVRRSQELTARAGREEEA